MPCVTEKIERMAAIRLRVVFREQFSGRPKLLETPLI